MTDVVIAILSVSKYKMSGWFNLNCRNVLYLGMDIVQDNRPSTTAIQFSHIYEKIKYHSTIATDVKCENKILTSTSTAYIRV